MSSKLLLTLSATMLATTVAYAQQSPMERFKLSPCGRYVGLVGSSRKGGGLINILDSGTAQWIAQVSDAVIPARSNTAVAFSLCCSILRISPECAGCTNRFTNLAATSALSAA